MRPLVLLLCFVFFDDGNTQTDLGIQPCNQRDSSCLRSSAQQILPIVASGIPSLGMKPLDPLAMDRVKTVQAGLRMDFKNTVVRGLRKCKVLDLRRFPVRTELDIKCSVTLIGDYSLGGKLLLLPIEGEGKYKIRIRDIVVKVVLDVDEQLRNGERYWVVKDFRHTADVLGWVRFNFQNLFNGNKKLADPIIEFSNSSWREIFDDMAPPILHTIVSHVVRETSKLFNQVPISKLVL